MRLLLKGIVEFDDEKTTTNINKVSSMGNVVVVPQTANLYLSPLGFHRYAAEFLKAAKGFQKTNTFSPVPYFLFSISIELALKAFLLAKNVSIASLISQIGHDLEKALAKAVELGLRDIVVISYHYEEELKKANCYYPTKAGKGFEYFQVGKAVRGYPNLPSLDVLSEFASTLVSKLEPICFQAVDGPVKSGLKLRKD